MDLKPIFQSVLDGQADVVLSGVKAALAARSSLGPAYSGPGSKSRFAAPCLIA